MITKREKLMNQLDKLLNTRGPAGETVEEITKRLDLPPSLRAYVIAKAAQIERLQNSGEKEYRRQLDQLGIFDEKLAEAGRDLVRAMQRALDEDETFSNLKKLLGVEVWVKVLIAALTSFAFSANETLNEIKNGELDRIESLLKQASEEVKGWGKEEADDPTFLSHG